MICVIIVCVRVCVEKLEQFPQAVLCQTHTEMFVQNRKEGYVLLILTVLMV